MAYPQRSQQRPPPSRYDQRAPPAATGWQQHQQQHQQHQAPANNGGYYHDQRYHDSGYDNQYDNHYGDNGGGYHDPGYNSQQGGYGGAQQSYGPPQGRSRSQPSGYGEHEHHQDYQHQQHHQQHQEQYSQNYAYGGGRQQQQQQQQQQPPAGYDDRRAASRNERPGTAQDNTRHRDRPRGQSRPGPRPPIHPPPSPENISWDNPFPSFPLKDKRKPAAVKTVEKDMAALDLGPGPASPTVRSPERPGTSNSQARRNDMSRRPPPAGPYDHDHQPGGPVRPGGGGGGAGGAGRPPHSAGHGGVEYDYGAPPPHRLERTHTDPNMEEPPLVPHINRSATVPAESAAPFPPPVAQPLYPGQSTYRDPAVAPPTRTYTPVLQSTVPPPRPSTAGGGAPRPTAPRVNTNVASSTGYYPQSASSQLSYHDRDPYSSPHDVLNSYHEPPVAMTAHIEEEEDDDDEADMPNFDAMPDVGGHGTPIDEHLPGLEDPRPKPPAGAGAGSGAPGYAAYNPGFAAQAHRARSQPNLRAGATTTTNQFDNAGFQFGLDAEAAPPMPPPVGRQDSRTGYGSNRPTPGGGGGGGGGGQQQSGYGDPMQYASPQSPVSIRGPPGGYGDLRGGYPARGPTPQQSLRSNNGPPRPYRINQGAGGTEESAPFENPDGLSHPPAPFRPGLDQGSKPMPVRQYNNSPAPGAAGVPPRNLTQTPAQQMPPPSAPASGPGNGGGGGNGGAAPTGAGAGTGKSAAVPSTPVTREELADLQVAVRSRPNDYKTALTLVKKLVEASTVLVGDERRVDAKTRAKTREKFVVDAYKLVKKLAHDGYPDAQFFLADCYGQGLLGLAADPKEAFSLYHSAAKAGHPQSAYRVAVCCEIGTEEGGGTKRDPFKAVQWYKRAAALGDPPAMYKMGMIMLKGLLGQARNPREGISWLKRAADRADADNPHALHELALMYESAAPNDIIVRDEDYARQLFHDAAELGYKFSQFRLGQAYEHGHLDLPVDQRQSIFWYTKAAAQGEHQSELALSGWYLTGADGILEQSDTEAYLWARKAASARLAKAEYAMGYFTEVGIGTASNLDDAKRWYWRAAAQGFPKARERLEDLKRGGTRMQKTRLSRSNVRQSEGDCLVM